MVGLETDLAVPDALTASERAELMTARRRRVSLPLLSTTASRARHLPLADESRAQDRKHRPVHAVWELTLRCDLACRHCGSRAGRSRPDELSLEEALDLVRQLAELEVREVTLIGGEAYLYDGWTRVVSEIRERGMSCTLVSGGRGITPELARAAADAGVQSVSISIDGDEPTHDRLRGVRGSYRSALAALTALQEAGIARALNSQINRLNMGQLSHLFEIASSHGCHGWQVIFTVPAGRAADEPSVLLQPYDLLSVLPALGQLSLRCSEAGIRLLPGNNVGYFGPLEHMLRGALRCPSQASCSAGRSVLGIEANGDIKGCPSLPTRSWVGGNVRDHSLRAIWERSAPLRYTRDLTVEGLWGYCRSCYYAEVCKGGCNWTSASLFRRPGNNPYCHHRALDFASRGLRERVVLTEAAPGESFDHGLWTIIVEPAASPADPSATHYRDL